MKGKYITTQIRLACAKKPVIVKDIYRELDETIQENKRIMRHFNKPSTSLVSVKRQERIRTMEGFYNHLSGQGFYPN